VQEKEKWTEMKGETKRKRKQKERPGKKEMKEDFSNVSCFY